MVTWKELRRALKETWGEALKDIKEDLQSTNQRVARLEQDALQPRLAIEADGPADTKTRERTEGAANAVQAKHGDSCTAQRVQDGPKTSISFGMKAEPPVFPCKDDGVVENGAAAPKSCFPPLKMRSTTSAGGLLPTSEASIVTRTTYNQTPLRLYSTGVMNSKTKLRAQILLVSYDSSFRKNKLRAAPSCLGVTETKSGQNRMFDPGGCHGRPRACPFLGTWRALLCGEVVRVGTAGDDLQRFWRIDDSRFKNLQEKETNRLRRVLRSIAILRYGSCEKVMPSRAARGYKS